MHFKVELTQTYLVKFKMYVEMNVDTISVNGELVVLVQAHFSLNSISIELQNFEFEHISSSSFIQFSSLSSNLETSLPRFGQNISSISSFIGFEFA